MLILTTDIFSRLGGGESVYRKLISDNPAIQFSFFETRKARTHDLPHNALAIPLRIKPKIRSVSGRYEFNRLIKPNDIFNQNRINAAELAEQYSFSAKGLEFDVIDVPEYEIVGNFLREALRRNLVKFKVLSSFIHGSLSRTLVFENHYSQATISEIKEIEKEQLEASDLFFILDSWYPNDLGLQPENCYTIDPWLFVSPENFHKKVQYSAESTALVYFGRWEKRKGIDALPELAMLVAVDGLRIVISGDTSAHKDLFSKISKSSSSRGVELENLESTNAREVFDSIAEQDILVVTSRFDSFNLVALEGLLAGKRVAISRESGVFHFLKNSHPELNFIEIDPNDLAWSANSIRQAISEVANAKSMIEANNRICSEIISKLNRVKYTEIIQSVIKERMNHVPLAEMSLEFKYFTASRNCMQKIKKIDTLRRISLKNIVQEPSNVSLRYLSFFKLIFIYCSSLPTLQILCSRVDKKMRYIYFKPRYFLNLVNEMNYSSLRKITYSIRCLRFSGYNNQRINSVNIMSDLERLGLSEEAKAIEVMTSNSATEDVYNYLQSRQKRLLEAPIFDFNTTLELASKINQSRPKISIIVSSYNAASKMEVFFSRLSLCEELKNGVAEVLVIDANSESLDAFVAVEIANKFGLTLRAMRVDRRISIQEAWNLGILNAQGKYLSFLGVDETIYPTALHSLAATLDSDDSIDWVMGNSIVTEVGDQGEMIREVMTYDRSKADKASPFLDTCYVSYVGGMYRKNIHEKFGYYDSTFRGAGDTEFKSRVLPALKVSYISSTLGEFLNYPEDRTTASEKVELEDIRAWYIFRTPGGLRYQASLSNADFLENIWKSSLDYRKSYCTHISTDLELASAIYEVAKSGSYKLSKNVFSELENAHRQLQSMRIFLGYGRRRWHFLGIRRFLSLAKWFDVEGRKSAIKGARRMRMDNMFEQHIWYWQ